MYNIPTSITIQDKSFGIRDKGDYRVVLDCFSALNDTELSEQERMIACLIIFYEDLNSIEDIEKLSDIEQAIKEMYRFFNCGEEDSIGAKFNYRLIDWDKDSQMISAAINKVANTEIRLAPYIHWWTFMGYYTAVGDSLLSQVVSIRHKIVTNKKLEKYEQDFKRDNPQYFVWNHKSLEEQEADDWVRQMWNSNQ